MKEMIITVVNMSIAASYVILAILLCRLAMKGMPKKYSYLLWSAAAFRLICPVSFHAIFSVFSLKPFDLEKAQSVNANALSFIQQPSDTAAGTISLGLSGTEIPLTAAPSAAPSAAPAAQSAGNPLFFWLAVLWITGMAALILYSAIRFLQLKRSLRTAVKLEGNVYYAEGIPSPFIVGLFRPKIYLTSGIDGANLEYALKHERVHLKRFDHGIKFFAWLLLTVHWFNPLVWLAFALMTRDMEMSCDEAVLSKMEGAKKGYGTALLSITANKKFPAPAPLAFGENGVKVRVKNVLKYKKPKLIIRALAVVMCLALITACAANPETSLTEEAEMLKSSLAGAETAQSATETQVGTGAEQNAGTGEGTSQPQKAEPDTETVTEIPAKETSTGETTEKENKIGDPPKEESPKGETPKEEIEPSGGTEPEPTVTERPRGSTPDDYLYPLPSQALFDRIARDEMATDKNIKSCRVWRYYGVFGTAVIVKFENEYYENVGFAGYVDVIRVDDVGIEDANGFRYRVWKDGNVYSLAEAYNDGNGFLTKNDMKMLARIIEEEKSIELIEP